MFNRGAEYRKARWLVALGLSLALLVALANFLYPLPPLYPDGPSTVVVSKEGVVLRSFGNKLGVHRYQTSVGQVDPFYIEALLNYEDRWFYYHPGVNPFSLVRALWQWGVNGRVISGGSTLTMQIARQIDPHSRSISGKLKQIWRALQLEWRYSKDELLTLYLNLAPFGGNIEGVEAAAQRYFSKSASNLTKNEAAMLVVMPQMPSLNRPDRYPERAKKVRNKVLARITESGLLSEEEYQLLIQEPVAVRWHQSPFFAPLLSQKLHRDKPDDEVITTTIDFGLQQKINKVFAQKKYALPAKTSAAVLIVDNASAEVLAYQGSIDFSDLERFAHIDMTQATRSPGSTLKPFIYGVALDMGLIHSESLLSDVPSSFSGYKPSNLNGKFLGAVSVSNALKLSLNVPAIQVLNRVTPEVFDQKLKQAGIHLQHKKANLSIGLGGTGTNLFDLVALYRSLANQGMVSSLKISPSQAQGRGKSLLSPESSWIIFDTLSDLSAPDRVVPTSRRKIAWKTGTSYGYRDFWSVGVSPDYTVAVWIGRPDSSPVVGYLGATQAAPLMFDLFDLLPRDKLQLTKPEKVKRVLTCWPGGRAYANSPEGRCLRKKYTLTIDKLTPPTMQSNGNFVLGDKWPSRLHVWQKQRAVVNREEQQEKVMITTLRSGQHYYQSQLDRLPLKTNLQSPEVSWFINHKPYNEKTLVLKDFKNEVNITACLNAVCDKKVIYIHD
ncbi:penicillin-binding protein 1C [Vibrio sp. SCSIO 43137]|uniref:penicillin-binding protein 1C n=1 Tax=Vibrio sp. SCSIO 43137 TaxID=3021011 RepID=UPI002307239F|nr:penicillin-binding protein 1C [Vibrio sp. SCSIO 43137]WCE30354.1 penicillin-binding protein 1C [Vibrio sp. SCSIO 43137]